MVSDAATANTSAASVAKDVGGKKKKANRSARLKQCKLDARREQWLSQVKNKACKVVNMQSSPPSTLCQVGKPNAAAGGRNPGMMMRGDENGEAVGFRDGDLHSRMSGLGSGVSGNRSVRKDSLRSASDAAAHENDINKIEGRGEGGLEDWEAVADALTARAGSRCSQNPKHAAADHESAGAALPRTGDGILGRPDFDRRIPRAWRPDDVFRPRSLPKQHTFPFNPERCCAQGKMSWADRGITSEPSSCPVCYEDLDITDSSFLPCPCGFRLCLFCHNKILEADGRCPGCRKQYSPTVNMAMGQNGDAQLLSLQMSRPYSMRSRS